MAGHETAKTKTVIDSAGASGNNLLLRVLSALVLAPLALAIAFIGGWPFVLFWGAAAAIILWEWNVIVTDINKSRVLVFGIATLAVVTTLAGLGRYGAALIFMVAGSVVTDLLAGPERRWWSGAGVVYASILIIAPTILRADPVFGFAAILVLFAIVWATDILGYFAGRIFGGAKLAPQISPKKTWAGAIGGTIGAAISMLAVLTFFHIPNAIVLGFLAVVLSGVSQAGDLCESAFKRRFHVKDASHLIPGHGGLMDRLDGFLMAAAVGAIIGVLRGGVEAPAHGLLIW